MSANTTIVNIRNFDASKVTFVVNPPKPQRPTMVSMKYDGQNFQLRLPSRMTCRFKEVMDDKKTKVLDYILTTNLTDCDPMAEQRAPGNTDIEKLYNALVFDLKERIWEEGTKNCEEWFREEEMNEIILKKMYKPMFKQSVTKNEKGLYKPDGRFPPSMRVKIGVWDGKVTTSIINPSGITVPVIPENLGNVFQPYCEVNMVVTPSIYVSGGNFGVTFRLNYAQVFPSNRITAASVFMNEEEQAPSQFSQQQAEPEAEVEQEEEQFVETRVEPPKETTSAPARKKRTPAH